MNSSAPTTDELSAQSFQFYLESLDLLQKSGIPFLVGGAYAFACYTGIVRHTKDLDVFLRRSDCDAALRAFSLAGFHAETVYDHWLAKAYCADDFIDLIYNSGNGECPVDDSWFAHARTGTVFGRTVQLVPAEEMIWQKMFIMERERFDGADVNHLIRMCGAGLDWSRLVDRTGSHWRVLLSHLVLYGYVYPGERDQLPSAVLQSLVARLDSSPHGSAAEPVCHGTKLSRLQYATDTEFWGYGDGRIEPHGHMTPEQALAWTDAGRRKS